MKKQPECCWSPLLLHYLLSPSLWLWSHGKSQSDGRGKEDLGLVYLWLCTICRHHLKVDSKALKPLWDILEGSGKGELSGWAELQAMHLVVCSSWKEKWPDVWLCTSSWAMANVLADGQGLGRKIIGKLVTRKFEEGNEQITLWMSKKTWRYLCPMWILTKRWP